MQSGISKIPMTLYKLISPGLRASITPLMPLDLGMWSATWRAVIILAVNVDACTMLSMSWRGMDVRDSGELPGGRRAEVAGEGTFVSGRRS